MEADTLGAAGNGQIEMDQQELAEGADDMVISKFEIDQI